MLLNCLLLFTLLTALLPDATTNKAAAPPLIIRVGAIFSNDANTKKAAHRQQHQLIESTFKYALYSLNRDKSILPDVQLICDEVQYYHQYQAFQAYKKVCAEIESGVQVIFGPSNQRLGATVHSICDALDIPHVETRGDDAIDCDSSSEISAHYIHDTHGDAEFFLDKDIVAQQLNDGAVRAGHCERRSSKHFSINLHPTQASVNDAILDVLQYLNWTRVGVLHEQNYGIIQLRKLMLTPHLEVYVHLIHERGAFGIHGLQHFKAREVHNIIIDTSTEHIATLLKIIVQLKMNEYKYHYLFTTFDIEAFDLEEFKYNLVNITAFRLINVADVRVKEILKDMEVYYNDFDIKPHGPKDYMGVSSTKQSFFNNGSDIYNIGSYRKFRTIQTAAALIYDAVYVFGIALQTLQQSRAVTLGNLSCYRDSPAWDVGLSLINYMNAVEWKGLTGPIQFTQGRRRQFKLDLVKLKQHSILKVGEWSPQTRLVISNQSLLYDADKINATLVVITILEMPYVMMNYGKNYTGNERFSGYCVDILELIARKVGFDYILDIVPDRKYGAKDSKTGEWNGMVEQLMKYKADLAVGSMTITHARESVIDFTKPFMNLGIGILFKIPTAPSKRLFSFMNPLAIEIWLYVLSAYILVSLTLYMLARYTPRRGRYEPERLTDNKVDYGYCEHCHLHFNGIGKQMHNCYSWNDIQRGAEAVNLADFTIANSFWFTIGTLMQQGSDINPKTIPTRIVSGIWWFFTLIVIASYTANLAAFLTVERMATPIENAEDLASQTEIAYGTLESGSTMTFFRDSLIEIYRKMWRSMDNNSNNNKGTNVFTQTYEEGIERVIKGNYAFLMESTMLDYTVQRNCNLTQIGGLLDTKGYGIATPKGSPWRDKISLAILQLQENGDIQMLYNKWWKNKRDTCVRQRDHSKTTKANALSLENIGGVFVVLAVGILVAILVAIFEFWQNYRQRHLYFNQYYRHQLSGSLQYCPTISNAAYATGHLCYGELQHGHIRSLRAEMCDEFRFALRCRHTSNYRLAVNCDHKLSPAHNKLINK